MKSRKLSLSVGGQDRVTLPDGLLRKYQPLIQRIAKKLLLRLPKTIQYEDLIQAGLLGLLEAAKHFDPEKGASFETYAAIRVRGGMLDEVRRENWLPRSVHRSARLLSQVASELEGNLGRDAHAQEIADALHLELSEYYKLEQQANYKNYSVLEENTSKADCNLDNLCDETNLDPLENLQLEDFYIFLEHCIENLSDRERSVLLLYYTQEMSLKEIGVKLGVSESRVCQIHSQAVTHLRARVAK